MTNHQHQGQQQDHGELQTGHRFGDRLREQARQATAVQALRLDVDGRLTAITYKGRPHHALRAPLGVRASDAPGGVGLEALDDDLTMWFDEYGAEHQAINPAASVVAAAFGRHGQVYGPVVFTGWVETGGTLGGRTCDISAAATILLAGIAASTDPSDGTSGELSVPRARRSAEWTGLGVQISRGPGPESFDALAWTVTRDGDVARCVECREPGSHPEHQPEALAAAAGESDEGQVERDPGRAVSHRKAGSGAGAGPVAR